MKWFKRNINELTDEQYNKYFGLMIDERKKYITSLASLEKKKQSVTGEMLVKIGVSSLLNINENEITISTKNNGKPYTNVKNIHFSISHSADYAVCAIDNAPIGIDIEKIGPVNLKVIERFCNEGEIEYIKSDDSVNRLFEIWTAKEAAYKMLDGKIKDFKKIDTSKLNKEYFYLDNYVVCIVKEN